MKTPLLHCALLAAPWLAVLAAAADDALPERRLSPQLRREALVSAPARVPLLAVAAFQASRRIVPPGELDAAPYLIGHAEGRQLFASGDLVFARGAWQEGVAVYDILRPGPAYRHPRSGADLGMAADRVGEARLLERSAQGARLQVLRSSAELRAGDRLLPRGPESLEADYRPLPPAFAVQGQVLDIGQGLAYGGQLDSLVLDLGLEQGLAPGHLLSLRKPALQVEDASTGDSFSFPGETFGSVLVYRVFARTSLALVLDSSAPVRLHDRVATPE